VKEKTSRRGLKRSIVPLLCLGFLSSASPIDLSAADDSSPAAAASNTDAAPAEAPAAASSPAVTVDPDNPGATASPTPLPSMDEPMLDTGGENPPKVPPPPAPEPAQPEATPEPTPEASPEPETPAEIEPPLPGATTQEAANGVPLGVNPALQQQFSEWDLAQVESPAFLSAAINEFNERPIMLTGNWGVKPHLSIGTFYDGNVFIQHDNTQSDYIARIAPGLTMRLGNDESMFYLVADYTVGFNIYLIHPNESTADQNLTAQLQWTLPKTVIGLNVNVSSDTGQDIDITNRAQQELYFVGLTGHYDFGEKTAWDASVDYNRSDYNGLISSSQVEGKLFFDYQYSPKTQVGIGGGTGVMMVPGSADQVYEDASVRATYQATGKITLISEAGIDFRQFGNGGGSAYTPVFVLEGAWQARPGTTLDLTARRSIYASAILDSQNYTATSLDFTVRQKMTDYVDISLAAGYVNSDYTSTAAGVDATREDNYFYVRPAVEWKALSWLGVGIFYEYSEDASQGGQANSFARDRAGVDLAIIF
jgi:hypothetical protein